MRYEMLRPLLIGTVLLCGGCATSIRVQAPTAGCSTLIPDSWRAAVPSAILPTDEDETRRWQVFGVGQTGQLKIANGRASDVIGVVEACEARDAASVRQIERPWYAFWR